MFVETVDQTTFATIISLKVLAIKTPALHSSVGHSTKVTDFSILINFIAFKDRQLNLFHTLILLESGIRLLSFLSSQNFKLINLFLATEVSTTKLQKTKEQKSVERDMNFTNNFIMYYICFI